MKLLWAAQMTSLCLLMTIFGLSAHAGGVGSGGGQGVVCRDHAGKITSVELFDLWEARQTHPEWKIEKSEKPLSLQIEEGIERLKFAIHLGTPFQQKTWPSPVEVSRLIRYYMDPFYPKKNTEFELIQLGRDSGVELALTSDSEEDLGVSTNSGCQKVQLVSYKTKKIYIRQDLVDLMDDTNRAALFLHEGFYKLLRSWTQEKTSLRARSAIAYAMSGHSFLPSEIEFMASKERVICQSKNTLPKEFTMVSFYYGPDGKMRMHVNAVAGVYPMGKTDFDISGLSGTPGGFWNVRALYFEQLAPNCEGCYSPLNVIYAGIGAGAAIDDEFEVILRAENPFEPGNRLNKVTVKIISTNDHKNDEVSAEVFCEYLLSN